MDLPGGVLLPAAWGALGVTILVCAALAGRPLAYRIGIGAVAALWLAAGAGANAWILAAGNTYTGFADASPLDFVTETWESLVVAHHQLFIGALILGEAAAAIAVLVPGRPRRIALGALIAFNLALIAFGWGFALWGLPIAAALTRLRRASGAPRAGGDQPLSL